MSHEKSWEINIPSGRVTSQSLHDVESTVGPQSFGSHSYPRTFLDAQSNKTLEEIPKETRMSGENTSSEFDTKGQNPSTDTDTVTDVNKNKPLEEPNGECEERQSAATSNISLQMVSEGNDPLSTPSIRLDTSYTDCEVRIADEGNIETDKSTLPLPSTKNLTQHLQEGSIDAGEAWDTGPARERLHTARITVGVTEERMAGEHRSYHEAITGEEAERRLEQRGGHCYLTRYSKIRGCYVLSVHKQHRLLSPVKEHYEIVIEGKTKCRIRGKTKIFDSIESLLEHYEQNRIDPSLRSIGVPYTEDEYEQAQEAKRQRRDEPELEKGKRRRRNKKCTMQ